MDQTNNKNICGTLFEVLKIEWYTPHESNGGRSLLPTDKPNAIQTVIRHLTNASSTASGLLDAEIDGRMQEAVKAINKEIIEAQNSNVAVLSEFMSIQQDLAGSKEEVRELTDQIQKLQNQNSRLEKYQLMSMSSGTKVFVLKAEAETKQFTHEACPNCFNENTISFLQPTGSQKLFSHRNVWFNINECPKCKSIYHYGNERPYNPGSFTVSHYDPFEDY